MRRVEGAKQRNKLDSFGSKEIQEWQRHPEVFKKYANQRVFQNKQIYLDDESNVVPDDVIVY